MGKGGAGPLASGLSTRKGLDVETGDILYFPDRPFHHIGMAYDARTVIHANHKKNFHKTSDQYETGSQSFYMSEGAGVEHFRPPWAKCSNADARKAELQRVADAIAAGAEYGKYRAVRLFAGDSAFGPEAFTRLMKYRERYEMGKATPDRFSKPGNEVIKTVTCSEAVIIAYQLTFPLGERPFFINLDGAHAMPNTLRTWLKASGWHKTR